jgi:hypothetical protein
MHDRSGFTRIRADTIEVIAGILTVMPGAPFLRTTATGFAGFGLAVRNPWAWEVRRTAPLSSPAGAQATIAH